MAKLSLEEVEGIAELARLSLTDDEKQMFQDQLSAILDYVEQLQGLDTDNTLASSSALPLDNVMRNDNQVPSFSVDEALSNAPAKADNQFRVKPILE
ncbi:MAG: Asp-tRNA(Asn)/Glu-tRNA(Gln) amidotransferase subunit GatC [Chloroflexota bacterium]